MKANLAALQEIVNSTPYDSNKKRFVSNLYWKFVAAGYSPAIVNDLYIDLDGKSYQLIQSKRNMSYNISII